MLTGPGLTPAVVPTSVARLARFAFDGAVDQLNAAWEGAAGRVAADAGDAAALMDLATVAQLCGMRADGLELQAKALEIARLYRSPARPGSAAPLRLLAFVAPGDFMANTPLEFLLENEDVVLDRLFVMPDMPLPTNIPEHDVAIVAVGESDAARPLLAALEPMLANWPRPVLNPPQHIAAMARDRLPLTLDGLPGVAVPRAVRVDRAGLERLGSDPAVLQEILPGASFPILVRPIASHAGDGLLKLDDAVSVAFYLMQRPEPLFYVSPFHDYSGSDGLFRKYRIALVGGRPFASHMAVSSHWMVHYLNAGMREDAAKRAEEAAFMAGFEQGFAARQGAALAGIAARLGLDYVALDCAEMPDGRLLVFEADIAMIVHAMDPPDLFPYKKPAMAKLFAGFRALLESRRNG